MSILDELEQDGYLTIHGIKIIHKAGVPMASLYHNPSISLTETGKQWMLSTGRVTLGSPNEQSSDRYQDGDELAINPTAFKIPRGASHSEQGLLVAVMMPFKREFDGVYETIASVCGKLGMTARKANDMWEDQTIVQDIFTLLYSADIVVVDFSGSNPNVMYETGIAHTLGKEVVPLAQNIGKRCCAVIGHHRVLQYVENKQGLEELAAKLLNKPSAIFLSAAMGRAGAFGDSERQLLEAAFPECPCGRTDPGQSLRELLIIMIAQLRGSPIAKPGAADLLQRDVHGACVPWRPSCARNAHRCWDRSG